MKNVRNLIDLFSNVEKLIVPSYQRAYAWEEEQLNQFISDMLEMKERGQYYYGHFILEEREGKIYEVIDGQQRLTTFILFLIVCNSFVKGGFDNFIGKFETVEYDENNFEMIKFKLETTKGDWDMEQFELKDNSTLSIQRMLFALNHFRKQFTDNKQKFKLDKSDIDIYYKILTEAHISTHCTNSKAVAVQIFEMQNTRGIKLNLIEKVKSRLMKAVYLCAEQSEAERIIRDIQNNFATIYSFEGIANKSSFIGELSLDDILFSHLTVVDDGSKLFSDDKNVFNFPSKWGNREDAILNYIESKIVGCTAFEVVNYVTKLVDNFKLSVELVIKKLPLFDMHNHFVGDVLILERNLSLEFLLILSNLYNDQIFENPNIFNLWEKFLFIRDFHDKYYQMKQRDDFPALFQFIVRKKENLEDILKKYIDDGFRPDIMDDKQLTKTVSNYIRNNESNILKNAFHWWNRKMVYILYKFERNQGADIVKLRNIMKGGRSVEHILPQEWHLEWIKERDTNNDKIISEEINSIINGIGNLLLITANENSAQSNNHPKDKFYVSCSGGSYEVQNSNREQWDDYKNWIPIIHERGQNIYKFINTYFPTESPERDSAE